MNRRLLTTIVLPFFSGCVDDAATWSEPPTWASDPCDPIPRARPSGNAPLASPFDQPLDDFVKVLAGAMGDRLEPRRANPHPSLGPDAEGTFWVTRFGVLWYGSDGRSDWLELESERVWPPLAEEPGRLALEDVLAKMGFPASAGLEIGYNVFNVGEHGPRRGEFRVHQTYAGETLAPAVIEGWVTEDRESGSRFQSGMTVRRVHELPTEAKTISAERAKSLAQKFHQCARGSSVEVFGDQNASWAIAHESLAYHVVVARGSKSCGGSGEGVYVDAVTGVILGFSGMQVSSSCD